METGLLTATDGFAIVMLAMILLSMSVIGILFLCMRRNVARRDPHVDDLLEEVAEEEKRQNTARVHGEVPKTPEPWEKDADWWKQ